MYSEEAEVALTAALPHLAPKDAEITLLRAALTRARSQDGIPIEEIDAVLGSPAPDPAEAMRAKTIYDHRRMVQEVAERYAGSLYQALKRMYDAVNERNVLRDGIESVVLADAASVLGRVDAALKGNGEGK